MPFRNLEELSMGKQSIVIEGQQTHGDSLFPFVLGWSKSSGDLQRAADWVLAERKQLLSLATRHGAVLLRGFPVTTANDFDTIVAALNIENFPYRKSLSNAVRINRTERVFSANEAPPEVQIFFHHEMAQTPLFPKWILFSCEVAPTSGGATPICRSDVLYNQLAEQCPAFIAACTEQGLKYSNVMPGVDDPNSGMGRSWQSTLGVSEVAEAEARLRELAYSWEWLPDNSLRATTPALPAILDVGDGRLTFFNQLIAAYCGWKDARNDPSKSITHGDGSPLDASAVMVAVSLAEELAFDLAWQVGDIVLIDNRIAMHARRPFTPPRKVLASLAEVQRNQFNPGARE